MKDQVQLTTSPLDLLRSKKKFNNIQILWRHKENNVKRAPIRISPRNIVSLDVFDGVSKRAFDHLNSVKEIKLIFWKQNFARSVRLYLFWQYRHPLIEVMQRSSHHWKHPIIFRRDKDADLSYKSTATSNRKFHQFINSSCIDEIIDRFFNQNTP